MNTYTNYIDTNEDLTVSIKTEFEGFDGEMFDTGQEDNLIWIEYTGTSPIA